jgi:VWFA-related protein
MCRRQFRSVRGARMSSFVLFLIPQTFLYLVMSAVPLFSGQARKKPVQPPLQHDVTVTLKLVQVYVTDPEGHPAGDLDKSDFVLYDNGELQEITGFEKHFLFAPRAEPEKVSPPEEPPAPSLMNRKFIFLIDYENNDLVGAAKARNAITQFLDTQVQPEDELALFSFSTKRGLVLHEYFTSDHQKIRAALKRVLEIPSIGGGWETLRPPGHSIMGMEAQGGVPSIVRALPRFSRGMYEVANALSEVAKALRHVPGQKNIILFSRGFGKAWPGDPAWEAFVAMSKDLATANILVFSVNTMTGWKKIELMPEDSLAFVSTTTGGKYFHDVDLYSNNAQDIQEVTSNYYVLGYSIESTWDGRFHDLKVEVKRPGYKVRAQKGYFNPLPFNKLSPVEKHFHLLDLALGEKAEIERHLNFPMSGLAFSEKEGPNTFLISEVPVAKIREAVGDDTEFVSLVFDRNKAVVDSSNEVINWASHKRDKVYHYSVVSLAPGSYDCRIVVRNRETGGAAVAAATAVVPERKEKGIQLFAPILLRPETGAFYLKGPESGLGTQGLGSPSLSDIFSVDAAQYVPLIEKKLTTDTTVWASVHCALAGPSTEGVELTSFLLDKMTGEEIAIPLTIMKEDTKEAMKTYLIRFRVPDLEPDEYTLFLVATDRSDGEMSAMGCDFVIE